MRFLALCDMLSESTNAQTNSVIPLFAPRFNKMPFFPFPYSYFVKVLNGSVNILPLQNKYESCDCYNLMGTQKPQPFGK